MLTDKDFEHAAEQRFTAAEFLLDKGYTLDAFYLAGYSVECILKALIMNLTPSANHAATFQRLKSGARYHHPETLAAELRNLGITLPLDLIRRFRRFNWDTSLRYESGRKNASEVWGYFKTATAAITWAKGVMK